MNRRLFLRSGAGAAACWLVAPAWSATPEANSKALAEEEVMARARTDIERHRQGAGAVRVRDERGQGIAGAKVAVEQERHEFLFGCNLFLFGRCGQPELEERYRNQFSAVFNYATLGFYWAAYEAERGRPGYEYTDQVLKWTAEQGIPCKGHPLVWDHPASSPRWLPDEPKEIERLSQARVGEIVSRYKDRIQIWDVVNEPTHLPDRRNKTKMAEWGRALGAVPYTREPLKTARAANPQAKLLVNDYRTDPPYYRILQTLREEDRSLFDVVGIQSHMHDGLWSLEKVQRLCGTYGQLGLPLHFTETTLVSGPRLGPGEKWGSTTPEGEARQAEQTAKFYTLLFAHPAVSALTWWDFSDRGAWQRAAAGWLRADLSPKPVYERLKALIKDTWWTRTNGTTDAQGEFKLRAFYGRHRLTAQLPDGRRLTRVVDWQRDRPNLWDLAL